MIKNPIQWPGGARCACAITFDIDADSLRIFYRKYGKYFNVTETVLENAVFEKNRLISKNATITKKGQHRIKVVIKDTLGRKSEETFRFKI